MQLLAGTSGFSFKEWQGHFYPEKLPAKEMLSYYAERFSTVEINNTFHRMPSEAVLERWAAEVSKSFEFTLKAPRRITHAMRLADAASPTREFLRRAAVLEDKLGVILFQLPPFLKKDLGRLDEFLEVLPAGTRAALEFRNATWQDDEVYERLRTHGVMLCVADTDRGDTPLVTTSDESYLRLRRTDYSDADLRAWRDRIADHPLRRVYVYFKHEDEALGTRFAQRLTELWNATDSNGEVHGDGGA